MRKGKKKTIVAVAHTILVIAYHMLKKNCPYEELGADYFDRLINGRSTVDSSGA